MPSANRKKTPPAMRFSKDDRTAMEEAQQKKETKDPIDFSKPYMVLAGVEQNPEVFLTPKGKSMIDPNERKKTNSHQVTVSRSDISEDNKHIRKTEINVMFLPARTDELAEEWNIPIEDVNKSIYYCRSCYPHRQAFFRMYEINVDELDDIEFSEDSEEIANARVTAVNDIDKAQAAMSKAGGKNVGIPGQTQSAGKPPIPNAKRTIRKPGASNVHIDNVDPASKDAVAALLASGAVTEEAFA